jgi:hypothetical protein
MRFPFLPAAVALALFVAPVLAAADEAPGPCEHPESGPNVALGECYERSGRFASAWSVYGDVARLAKNAADEATENDARAHAEAVAPRVPHLVIVVSHDPEARLRITRNGATVTRTLWGTPVPVDAGEHVIVASATGHTPWDTHVAISEGERMVVEVPRLPEIAPASAPVSESAGPAATPAEPAAKRPDRPRAARGAAIILGAGGALALVTGAAFGIASIAEYDSSSSYCRGDNLCQARGVDLRDDAIRHGNVATVAFVAAAVLGAAATTVWFAF